MIEALNIAMLRDEHKFICKKTLFPELILW